jgi:hypothetical protein
MVMLKGYVVGYQTPAGRNYFGYLTAKKVDRKTYQNQKEEKRINFPLITIGTLKINQVVSNEVYKKIKNYFKDFNVLIIEYD